MGRRKEGLSADDSLLRKLLLIILEKNDFRGLLRENGGKVTFGDIWSVPFFGRKGMVRGVCTIKKRDHQTSWSFAVKEQMINLIIMTPFAYPDLVE